jgi:hypothetical protein
LDLSISEHGRVSIDFEKVRLQIMVYEDITAEQLISASLLDEFAIGSS